MLDNNTLHSSHSVIRNLKKSETARRNLEESPNISAFVLNSSWTRTNARFLLPRRLGFPPESQDAGALVLGDRQHSALHLQFAQRGHRV